MNDAYMEALIKLKNESRQEKLVFAYFDGRPIDFVHIAEREFNKAIKVSGVK